MRLLLALAALLLGAPAAASAMPYDLDGNGRQDALLGVPGWSPGGAPNAGAVIALGDLGRRLSRRPRVVMEGSHGLPGVPEGDDAFGSSVASADFDGDGRADLAIAATGENTTFVIPSGPSGLRYGGAQTVSHAGSLVAADLDGDGYGDLAIGDASASPRGDYGSGAIRLYRGSRQGLRIGQPRTLRRPRSGIDGFGSALAVGDVNGDRRPDIVEGHQGEVQDTDGEGVPGGLSFCAGSRSGPRRCRALGHPFAGGPVTLAVSDLDGDGFGDVIGGRPVASYVADDDPPGAVSIWPGSRRGPSRKAMRLTARRLGVLASRRSRGDAFGAALTAGDLNGDGHVDLAIGVPGQGHARGQVMIVPGTAAGPSRIAAVTLREGAAGIPGARRAHDQFGAALTLLAARSGPPMLVIGAPGDRSITTALTPLGRHPRPRRLTASSIKLDVPPEPPDALGGFGSWLARPFGS